MFDAWTWHVGVKLISFNPFSFITINICSIQFDPEAFVDGLLGIGEAGGSSNKNEGKALANRLDEMRKARDDRAKEMKQKKEKKVPVGAGMMNGIGGGGGPGMTLDTSAMESSMMDGPSNGSRPPSPGGNPNKSKKKKKKKKKN